MKTIKLSAASRSLAEYAAELSGEILLLTDRSTPVAAIVPLKGVDRESIALSAHPGFLSIIARSRAQFERGETMSLAEMKASFSGAAGRKTGSPGARRPPTRARRSAPAGRGDASRRRTVRRKR